METIVKYFSNGYGLEVVKSETGVINVYTTINEYHAVRETRKSTLHSIILDELTRMSEAMNNNVNPLVYKSRFSESSDWLEDSKSLLTLFGEIEHVNQTIKVTKGDMVLFLEKINDNEWEISTESPKTGYTSVRFEKKDFLTQLLRSGIFVGMVVL